MMAFFAAPAATADDDATEDVDDADEDVDISDGVVLPLRGGSLAVVLLLALLLPFSLVAAWSWAPDMLGGG